jgi:hypothetical protein|tara:strand:+ start:3364 stop:3561 length:198 start_codon:yes stop_codon:yes gene_type:complete
MKLNIGPNTFIELDKYKVKMLKKKINRVADIKFLSNSLVLLIKNNTNAKNVDNNTNGAANPRDEV